MFQNKSSNWKIICNSLHKKKQWYTFIIKTSSSSYNIINIYLSYRNRRFFANENLKNKADITMTKIKTLNKILSRKATFTRKLRNERNENI